MQFVIIATSETRAELDLINNYNINNYNGYHITSGVRRGGGVAIYTSKELSCKLLENKSMTVGHIFECVSVELSINNYSNVIISCVYRTPGSNFETFCEKIESILWGAKSAKIIFVCGVFQCRFVKA